MSEELVARLLSEGGLDSSGRFSWDFQRQGQVLEQYQLPDPEHYLLRALACAVAGGATYFRLEQGALTTRLSWDGAEVSNEQFAELSPLAGESRLRDLALALLGAHRLGRVEFFWGFREARLILKRSGWRHLFGRSRSLILLAERGRYARLRLEPPIGAPRIADPLVVFESPWGDGRVGWGASKTVVVRDGVSFAGPTIPGLEVTWWTNNLSLDLSRSSLVHGPELAEWFHQLTGKVMAMLTNPARPKAFRRWALAHGVGHPSFETAPIFGLANGGWTTYEELRQEYETAGYLRVVPKPQPLPVVVDDAWSREFLTLHFRRRVNVDGLEDRFIRLPEDQPYLLKWATRRGEIGLRPVIALEFREWDGSAWHFRATQPFGVDVAGGFSGWQGWPEALRSLAEFRGPADTLVQFHFLSFLSGYTSAIPGSRLRLWREQGQDIDLLDLVEFRLRCGGTVSLARLLEEGGPCASREILVEPRVASLLERLLAPETRVNPGVQRFSRRASRLLRGDLVENLLSDPTCAGTQVLRASGASDPKEVGPWLERLPRVLGSNRRVATSVHLLLASGFEASEELVAEWGERENLEELLEDEPHFVDDLRASWLVRLVWCQARAGHLEQALARARQAVLEFPESWLAWDTLGQIQACLGDLGSAESSHRWSLKLQGYFPRMTAHLAETLWAAGKVWDAWEYVGTDELMKVRLEDNLEVALELCRRLLERPDCPLSVHERMAEVLLGLSEVQEARTHYQLFVAARPDLVLEANIVARREAAVRWLLRHS